MALSEQKREMQNWLIRLTEVQLYALLIFAPWAFGAVEAWSQMVMVFLACSMLATWIAYRVARGYIRRVRSLAYLFVFAFVGLVLFQLVPLPSGLLGVISPHTVSLRSELLGDLGGYSGGGTSGTVSLYPYATWHTLRLLLVVVVVFAVALNTIRHRSQIKRVLAVIAVNGVIFAVFAIVQRLAWNGKIYWSIRPSSGAVAMGAFVNHGHYAQFMNLSIGAGLGLLMLWLSELFDKGSLGLADVATRLGDRESRKCWWLAGGLAVAIASVFVSLSRMGMLSLLIAGALTAMVIGARRALRARGWVLAALATAALVCVLWVGFDAVCDRLATLKDPLEGMRGRIDIVKDIGVMMGKFPLLGTGLGTHEVVYPMFKQGIRPGLFQYAENEYAQAGEETGIIGLVILLGFAALVVRRYIRGVRLGHGPMAAVLIGLGFGLFAVALHSLSDFAQRIPANAALTAVTCALVLTISKSVVSKEGQGEDVQRDANWRIGSSSDVVYHGPGARVIICLAGAAAIVWMSVSAVRAYVGERHWDAALAIEKRVANNDWQASDKVYADLIESAEGAVAAQPDNVHYRYWLNLYRWRAISRRRDPDGNILLTVQDLETTTDIVAGLNRARVNCPTFGPTYCVLGQIERFVLREPVGDTHIRLGYRLDPSEETACFVAGCLCAEQGDFELAAERFARSLAISPQYYPEIKRIYLHELHRPADLLQICSDRADRLLDIAYAIERGGRPDAALVAEARSQAAALMEKEILAGRPAPQTLAHLASIYLDSGKDQRAVEYYRAALDTQYGNVHWRYRYALALVKVGRSKDALKEAQLCLRLSPGHEGAACLADRLVDELVRSGP